MGKGNKQRSLQQLIQMGASTQKSIKNITQGKYSFVHPKSQYPLQISCWKFTEEELEHRQDCEGEALRWPFKLYSDEGYLFACIENSNFPMQSKAEKGQQDPWKQFARLKVTVGLIEFLYSFAHRQVQQYAEVKIELQNQSKYIKDSFTLTIYVYVGENLSSLAKLKLMSVATSLERYISRGGMCSISKLYHQYEEIVDLGKEIKERGQNKAKGDQFYLEAGTLVEDKIKLVEDQKMRKQLEAKEFMHLYEKFMGYHLIGRVLIDPFVKNHSRNSLIFQLNSKGNKYPSMDCSAWSLHKNLITKTQAVKKSAPIKKQEKKEEEKVEKVEENLNESLPFACQITQINFKEKKKVGDAQQINDSMSIAQLSVLGQRNSNFVKLQSDQQDYLILTDYTSIRQYSKCLELNIRLIINNSASVCYNYFINDFQYIWNYITPLPTKIPADAILFQYNIQHLMEKITDAIIHSTSSNKKGDALNNKIAIYSSSSPFSDENCAIVIGYFICRYLYTYDKAFEVLNRAFREYKKSKEAQLQIHKLYIDQLLALEGRILITSLSNYGVSLNSSAWRAYQVSNNHCHPCHQLINRYIGQLSNLNQIQSLPNHSHHLFIVISHQLVPVLSSLIQKWEKDTNTKVPQAITGIKILVGKEFQYKEEYITKAKEMIALILKYEFINRNKNNQSFKNQFLLKFIQEVVASNIQIQNIQKSFRKPQPLTPLYHGFQQENPGIQLQKLIQPFNSKEKLTFKYPYIRPTWQSIKDDQCYFIVQVRPEGASIQIIKGKHWIGLQIDKQAFFQKIVKMYMPSIDQSKIWITQQGQQSLFGQHIDLQY